MLKTSNRLRTENQELKTETKELKKELGKMKDLVDYGISERQIRNNGGLPQIKKNAFPEVEKNLRTIAELKEQNSYTTKLENELGKRLFL